MAVAKRQRGKPVKIEQRKVWGQTDLLASPIYIGQRSGGGDKCIKGGSLEGLRPLFSLFFWVGPPSLLKAVLPFVFPKKTAVTLICLSLQIFAVARENWGNYKVPRQYQHTAEPHSMLWLACSWFTNCLFGVCSSKFLPVMTSIMHWF